MYLLGTAGGAGGSGTGTAMGWNGGQGVFAAVGTFGGVTVKLQWLMPDGSTWADVGTDTTLSAAGGGRFFLPPGQIRAVAAVGASAIFATAEQVKT